MVHLARDGQEQTLVSGSPAQTVLSDDGSTIAVIERLRRRGTRVDVRSSADGTLLASRDDFRSYPSLLDLDGDHLVVASFAAGARDWNWSADTVQRISRKPVYRVDLGTDRLAFFTGDPYDGGCSVVTTLARPRTRLWRSCHEAVRAFSTDGARLVTTDKLADGIGPGRVWERTVRGRLLASYTVAQFIGTIAWESPVDLLLDVHGRHQVTTVRCSAGDCERASDARPDELS